MAKVYLSPALHAYDNPCSYGKGCTENTHCNAYMDMLIPYLDACGIQWKRSDKKNTGAGYSKTIAESNAFAPDIHFVKHTNACAGHNAAGSRIFVWPTGKGKQLAELMLKHRKSFYPNGGKVVENSTLTEIRNTKAVCIYDEIVFHDNPNDIKHLHEKMQEFVKADAKALCEYFGIPFREPQKEQPAEKEPVVLKGLYAVQVGAFSKKENAEKLAAELQKKGYSTYIVQK